MAIFQEMFQHERFANLPTMVTNPFMKFSYVIFMAFRTFNVID